MFSVPSTLPGTCKTSGILKRLTGSVVGKYLLGGSEASDMKIWWHPILGSSRQLRDVNFGIS